MVVRQAYRTKCYISIALILGFLSRSKDHEKN